MSDQLPLGPSGGDRVRDTLTELRSDAERVGLDDPASVRRRGQARTRHQALASLAAVVVVVAVAVSGGALFRGSSKDDPTVIATHPPTPESLGIASDPFLRDGDVSAVGPYETFQRSTQPVIADQRPVQCIPSPTTLGATETKGQLYSGDLDATFIEHVLRFDEAAAAAAAVSQLSSAFASCDKGKPNEATVDDRGPQRAAGAEGGSETLHASRLTTPTADAGISYYELGVARSANVVVVLEWSSMGKPVADPAAWVWSAELLDTAAHQATG